MAWVFLFTLYCLPATDGEVPRFGHQITMEVRAQSAETCERFRTFLEGQLLDYKVRHMIAERCEREALPPELPDGEVKH